MFTGIIEAVGTVQTLRPSGQRMLLSVDIKHLAEGTMLGDSIAVNGVCLTVCALDRQTASFDVSSETVKRSSLSKLKVGSLANLERAMSAQGRFGGHIVQGHIDGTAKIASIRKEAAFAEFGFDVPSDLMTQIILKGSVAVDGISLTVSRLEKSGFTVALIPTTLSQTTCQNAKVGDIVNIETDILVKIIQKQLAALASDKTGLTIATLLENGF